MTRILLAASLLGLLAGCAEWAWVRPDTPVAQLDHDRNECRSSASALARHRYPKERWLPAATQMEIERYESERSSNETDRNLYEERAFRSCMEERGYRLVERPPA